MQLRSFLIVGGLAIGLVSLPVQASSFTTSATGGTGLQGGTASSTLEFDFSSSYDLAAANLDINYNPGALRLDTANSTVQLGGTSYVLGNLQSGPSALLDPINNDVSNGLYSLSFVPLDPATRTNPSDPYTCTPTTLPFSPGDKVLLSLQFLIPDAADPGNHSVAYSGSLIDKNDNNDDFNQSPIVRVEPSTQPMPLPATWLLLIPDLALIHRLQSQRTYGGHC
jgi:hypothetical protein